MSSNTLRILKNFSTALTQVKDSLRFMDYLVPQLNEQDPRPLKGTDHGEAKDH
jgi:hypothetical protein